MSIFTTLQNVRARQAVKDQAIHFLTAYAIVLTAAALWQQPGWAAIGLIAFVFFLELWWDPRYENDPFIVAGLIDLGFYCAGIGAAFWLIER